MLDTTRLNSRAEYGSTVETKKQEDSKSPKKVGFKINNSGIHHKYLDEEEEKIEKTYAPKFASGQGRNGIISEDLPAKYFSLAGNPRENSTDRADLSNSKITIDIAGSGIYPEDRYRVSRPGED